ncbi:MAG: hypothetical protein IKL66_07985 [Clostridia bacterium]|nr:hypothetical protein [Clostridia bacterium]
MKYSNSLKYMNSFSPAKTPADISQKRITDLCKRLGRVNVGTRYIYVPDGSAGHACAVLLENIIKSSEHSVGRIMSCCDFDSRSSILIGGETVSIETYNKSVTALKSVAKNDPDDMYTREEMVLALGLLICKLEACEYVILEGLSKDGMALDAICAPYDLIVVPTVYEGSGAADKIKTVCDVIRRGTREVVSGNQRSDVYNKISQACAISGVRLYIPAKAQFETTDISARNLNFNYGGKEGYTLRSPSHVLRDCAMTAVEASLALRRGGVKMPWNGIFNGLSSASDTRCFEMISASPIIVTDSASVREELIPMLKTADELWGASESFSIVVSPNEKTSLSSLFSAFSGRKLNNVVLVNCETEEESSTDNLIRCRSVKEAAKELLGLSKSEQLIFCFGSVDFAAEIKGEFFKAMNN